MTCATFGTKGAKTNPEPGHDGERCLLGGVTFHVVGFVLCCVTISLVF